MGSGIIKLLLQKRGIKLVGVQAQRLQRVGREVGEVVGLGRDIGLRVTHDLPELLQRVRPHVVIQATCSTIAAAREDITTILRHGAHVISIAEEMAYPACTAPEVAERLHALAVAHGVSVVGTGINPGFVLDVLVIALTGVCARVEAITATRVNDLAPYGPSVLRSQGVGLTPEAFREGVAQGAVVGHIGFPESISMIAHAVGWRIDRVEQQREPIISTVTRRTPFVTIEPGQTAGCLHTAVAYREGKPVIRLYHPQQVQPHLENIATGDRIDILGEPHLRLSSSPEIPGGIGTVALAVNMIPRVLTATPGLHSMADLPVPAALMGDIRTLMQTMRTSHGSTCSQGYVG
jgi:4-hydroxy-tetrahydrodipicolinate reductase